MSSGAKVVSHCIKEVTPGTTPASGTWQTMRLTGNTLSPTPSTLVSDEITDSRISQGSVVTGLTIAGDLTGELSYGTFDDWLAAAFYGAWASDVLTIGAVRNTFSVQKAFTDVGTYHLFKGVHAATAAIDIPEEGKVTLTIGAQCLDYRDAETTFVTGSPAAATTTPFMSSLAVGDIKVDDVSLAGSACVSAMTINIDNTVQLQRCLGSGRLGPGAIIETEAAVTGTITLAWSKRAWQIWKEQLSRKAFEVEFPITDSLGNSYTFNFPSIEVDGELPNGGKRDIIQVTLNWTVAKVAPTITRAPAAAPTSVTVTPSAPEVDVGDTVQMSASVSPGGASQAVTWHSSDLAVATVNGSGLVTGVSAGTAVITAYSTVDPTKSDSETVTVS
ncbi:phage tail tube protein [Parapusillimonas sp. JC17]|uniref:phage tail tube protein n=1 Tax=Parapusillimonas sp. JC17 TaxID=3445768 RepID=UPI003FA059BD